MVNVSGCFSKHLRSTCSNCSANAACGQGLMERLGIGRQRGYVRALSQKQLAIGDSVIIGVREDLLVRSSLLVYLLPLLGLFAAALLADGLGLSEPLVILAGLSGLFASWLMVRWRAARAPRAARPRHWQSAAGRTAARTPG